MHLHASDPGCCREKPAHGRIQGKEEYRIALSIDPRYVLIRRPVMRRIILTSTVILAAFLASLVVIPGTSVHAQSSPTNPGPTVTATPSTVAAGGTTTVQGTGFTPNNYVFVYWQRPDGTTNGSYGLTDASGRFSFTLGFDPRHGTGIEYIAAYDYATGRWSPYTTVTVTAGGGPPPPTTGERLSAAPNPAVVGNITMVSGAGFSPNNYVYVQWQRPDGTTNAVYVLTDPSGSFSFQLQFLRVHGCGTETLQAYDYGTNTVSAPYAITVTGC
jgi:hypothetical protein